MMQDNPHDAKLDPDAQLPLEAPKAVPTAHASSRPTTVEITQVTSANTQTQSRDGSTLKQELTIVEHEVLSNKGVVSLEQDLQVVEHDVLRMEQSSTAHEIEKEVKPYEEFLLKFANDWCANLAASLAYHLLTAMFPIAIVFISILSVLQPDTRHALLSQMTKFLPPPLSSTDIVTTISNKLPVSSGLLWFLAILLAVFTGSRLFVLIDSCFNIIYQVRSRSILKQNLVAIAMLLLFVVLTPIMIATSSASGAMVGLVGDDILKTFPAGLFFTLLSTLGSLLASLILFGAIYVIVPHQHISIHNSWRGALVAALALQIYLQIFPIYATHLLGGYAGQVGFAIILLAFFYYFAIILLLGAQVNAFFAEGVRAIPVDFATYVHTFVDANKDVQIRTRTAVVPRAKPASSTSSQSDLPS